MLFPASEISLSVRQIVSGLLSLLMLASAIATFSAHAHIGVAEEIERITAQLKDNPDALELFLLRGELHRVHGHWTEAIDDFQKVQHLDPGNTTAALGLGRTCLDRGLYQQAIKHLNHTLSRQPGNVRALVARAKALRGFGKPLAAAADYQRAMETFKEPAKPLPEYYLERARAFDEAGTSYSGAAIRSLDEGISRLGDIRVLEDYAVELERKRHHFSSALQRLDRMLDRPGRKETLLMRRGEILLEYGRPTQAGADFTAAGDAIDKLPPQRRHSRLMKQLRKDIDRRLYSLKNSGGEE